MTTLHAAKLSELAQRVVTIDSEIASLDTQYAELAARFDTGSKEALRQAEQIEVKTSGLRRERALVNAACARIEELRKSELIEIEEQAKRQQLQQAREIADAICAAHVEIDRILVTLRERLERRASLLSQLQRLDLDTGGVVNRLLQRAVVTRACCAAGLHKFAELQTVAPNSMVRLASSNQILLGIGRAPASFRTGVDVESTSTSHAPAEPETGATSEVENGGTPQRRRLLKSAGNGGAT
jgi:hypothetical protein